MVVIEVVVVVLVVAVVVSAVTPVLHTCFVEGSVTDS